MKSISLQSILIDIVLFFLAAVVIFLYTTPAHGDVLCVRNKAKVTRKDRVILKKHVSRVAGSCPEGFTEVGNINESTLPSGQSLKGYYYVAGTAAAASAFAVDSISFGYELSAAPTAHYIETTDTAPAECPGTAAAPEADPGHLCVYEGTATNLGARNTHTFNGGDGSSLTIGAGVYIRSAAAGTFAARGTWAVTAP